MSALVRTTRAIALQRPTCHRTVALGARPLRFNRPQVVRRATIREEEEEEEEYVEEEAAPSGFDTDELVANLQDKWDSIDNKPQFFGLCAGAIGGLWLTIQIVAGVKDVPLVPEALELVGLGYAAWFTYRYLLFKEKRQDLQRDIEVLKARLVGGDQ